MRQSPDLPELGGLVGQRVVVRHRLHGQKFAATDVIGVLEFWSDGQLRVIRGRDAAVIDVAESDLIVVKAIPPRTVTRRAVRDLEGAAMLAWRALDAEPLGGWLLRAAGGFSRRANSCLPLDDPGLPLPAAVDAVERWYERRGLPPMMQVIEPLGHALIAQLDTRGWSAAENSTVVMTTGVDELATAARPDLPAVAVRSRPDQVWLDSYHHSGGTLPATAETVLVNAETVGFASVDEAGRRIAVARGAVSDAPSGRRWLGVTAVEVAPDAHRRGLGSHIVAELARWAAEHAASDAYLQVGAHNETARTGYERLGFVEHHRYHYRRRPGQ